MSALNKSGFYLIAVIVGVYYGLFPLFGVEVWVRNKGWVYMDMKQSLFNLVISIFIFFYLKKKY